MEAATDYLHLVFSGIRNSKAHPDFLASIKVLIDKDRLPLEHIALVSLSGNHCLKIEPYVKEWAMPIEKAVNDASLGVTTDRHKEIVFVRIPPPSGERKEQFAKMAREMTEKQKIAIRNIRREARSALPQQQKEIEQLTKQYMDQVDSMLQKKLDQLNATIM